MLSVDLLRFFWCLFVVLVGLVVLLVLANGSNKGRSMRLVFAYIILMSILLGGLWYLNGNAVLVLGWFS